MRYWVAAHARDLGIRVALGADRGHVIRLVLRRAATALAGGLALGLAGAVALRKLIAAELYDVSPADPAVMAAMAALLSATALAAAFAPARRAASADPVAILRQE
jgi:ABC-type antimicrobial peptide transport system permease subunit